MDKRLLKVEADVERCSKASALVLVDGVCVCVCARARVTYVRVPEHTCACVTRTACASAPQKHRLLAQTR
jgi:hypothetical protein